MDTLIVILIGFVAGILGGLLGIGGSIVMIPALTEALGPRPHLYQAAAMIVNFFVVAPALIQHAKVKAIIFPIVRSMAPSAGIAVLVGVWTSELDIFRGHGQATLILMFGVFLLWVAGRQVMAIWSNPIRPENQDADQYRNGWRAALWIGAPMGFIAGLLGVGGGVICVPFQVRFLKVPLRQAIANSAATILVLSLIGAILKNAALVTSHHDIHLIDSLRLAGTLIPPAIVGSMLGSRLTHTLPIKILRVALVLILLAASARMIVISRSLSAKEAAATPSTTAQSSDVPSTE
ncbi:MAG TPA: sulfite exporter TauE/SafE family protein [Phycisphaerae bacterium]|nr:sulfite exporter TauE/SafE family protein [Phycisphaerae bacterium]